SLKPCGPIATWRATTGEFAMNYVATIRAQLLEMREGFITSLPNLAVALVVLLVTWLIGRSAVRIVNRIYRHTHVRNDLRNLTETIVKVVIWVIGLLIAAAVAIPGFTAAGMLAGLGVGALAIGFA